MELEFNIDDAIASLRRAAATWFTDSLSPPIAVTLGSGLGGLVDRIERAEHVPYGHVAGLPSATAAGHRGEFVLGWIGPTRVIAMAGRLHAYEGHGIDQLTRPMRVMCSLRPRGVIVSCAAGGLNHRFRVGDLALIDEHIGMIHGRPGAGRFPVSRAESNFDSNTASDSHGDHPVAAQFRCGRPTCDESLASVAESVAARNGFRLHRATYLAVTGPTYETRAECRMMRGWGADLVGMSTVPELVLASRSGHRTLGIAVVTNLALPDAPATADHSDVLQASAAAGKQLEDIVTAIARSA